MKRFQATLNTSYAFSAENEKEATKLAYQILSKEINDETVSLEIIELEGE